MQALRLVCPPVRTTAGLASVVHQAAAPATAQAVRDGLNVGARDGGHDHICSAALTVKDAAAQIADRSCGRLLYPGAQSAAPQPLQCEVHCGRHAWGRGVPQPARQAAVAFYACQHKDAVRDYQPQSAAQATGQGPSAAGRHDEAAAFGAVGAK